MRWYNAVRDSLPKESGKIILSVRGVYYQALYDKEKNIFIFDDGGVTRVLEHTNDQIYWCERTQPPKIHKETFKVVIADDDIDDQFFIKNAFRQCDQKIEVDAVFNGVQLMDYLLRRNAYEALETTPDLILLDLNMPLMDGFKVLAELKKHDTLKQIPVYVLTTSRSSEDLTRVIDRGALGIFSKGSSSKDIRKIVEELCHQVFWPKKE